MLQVLWVLRLRWRGRHGTPPERQIIAIGARYTGNFGVSTVTSYDCPEDLNNDPWHMVKGLHM